MKKKLHKKFHVVYIFDNRAMSFINPALSTEQQYTDSVTYNTCPFSNVIPNPLLAVHPQDPTGRLCLSTAPPETEQTHGGFHRETRLATSNVIGLLNRYFEASLMYKLVYHSKNYIQ